MTEKIKKKLEEIWCQLEYLRISFSSRKNYPSSKSVCACMHAYIFACIHTCVCMYVCVLGFKESVQTTIGGNPEGISVTVFE